MGYAPPAERPRPGDAAPRSARLSGAALAVVGGLAGLAILFTTDQVLPATSAHQAQLRMWIGSRAAGLMALVFLTFQVVVGLILSHPTNKATWRLSKRLFPWHEHAWVFTLAFIAVHVISIATDRFAKVGWLGAIVPGMSEYRTVPVAIGTLTLYAIVITGATARVTRLLPAGWWLKLHRFSLVVLALAWAHGLLAGSDTFDAVAIYAASFAAVLGAATYRYWIVRAARPRPATALAREAPR